MNYASAISFCKLKEVKNKFEITLQVRFSFFPAPTASACCPFREGPWTEPLVRAAVWSTPNRLEVCRRLPPRRSR